MTAASTTTSLLQTSLDAGGESDVIQLWVGALASRKWVERHDARTHLAKVGDLAVAPVASLLDDPREHVRWEAAKTLSDMVSPAAAPVLVRALSDESFGVRWVAAEGLVRLGRDALEPLFEALMLKPRSVYLRVGAHHVLIAARRWGDADLVEPVIAALGSFSPRVELPLVARDALIRVQRSGRAA